MNARMKLSWLVLIPAWIAVVFLLVGLGAFTFKLIQVTKEAFKKVESVEAFVPSEPPVPPPEVDVPTFVPDAEDSRHNKASLAIYLLSDEYKWKIGYDQKLNDKYDKLPFSGQMVDLLNKTREVICVGASSEEIIKGLTEDEGRKKEEERAARRAKSVAIWITEKLERQDPSILVRKWNIGHWMNRSNGSDTSTQRRVIIILVLNKSSEINMDEALRNALEREKGKHHIYELILNQYSLTRGDKLIWDE
jgi:hypothetical protein